MKAKREVGERATAQALGVTEKTLQNYRARKPPVPFSKRGGRVLYNVEEVQAYRVEQGLVGDDAPAPGQASAAAGADAAAKTLARRAGTAVTALKAERAKLQLEAERGLKDLGLDTKIHAAQTTEALSQLIREVAALMANGTLSGDRGRAILEALREQRQNLKVLDADRKREEAFDKAFMVTAEAVDVVRAFEGITEPARRERAARMVAAIAEEDRLERPNVDTGEAM